MRPQMRLQFFRNLQSKLLLNIGKMVLCHIKFSTTGNFIDYQLQIARKVVRAFCKLRDVPPLYAQFYACKVLHFYKNSQIVLSKLRKMYYQKNVDWEVSFRDQKLWEIPKNHCKKFYPVLIPHKLKAVFDNFYQFVTHHNFVFVTWSRHASLFQDNFWVFDIFRGFFSLLFRTHSYIDLIFSIF